MAVDVKSLDVLVVDDHPDLCRMMVRLIELCGHRGSCVLDGAAALRTVKASRPDLIILDVTMPGLSGFDVLTSLRADASLSSIPVVMCSAIGDAASVQRAEALGVRDYLVKGRITFDAFRSLISRYAEMWTGRDH